MPTTSLEFSLDRGERQLWAGTPRQGVVFRASDVFMIPFSLLWGGFAIFWLLTALRSGGPGYFSLWGIPFVLVAFFMIVGRFFVDAWSRARTTYAVTSERVIINSGLFMTTTQSLDVRTLTNMTVQERPNGTGTITFGAVNPFAAMYPGTSRLTVQQMPRFYLIPDARRVYNIIREAQQAPAAPAAQP